MATSWLRLWHDMPNDPKFRTISRISKQSVPAVLSVYIHILVAASSGRERGQIQSGCFEDIASALDLEREQVEQIIQAMQGRVLDGDKVSGWDKRQPDTEGNAARRSKEWREARRKEREVAVQTKETHNKTKRSQTLGNVTEQNVLSVVSVETVLPTSNGTLGLFDGKGGSVILEQVSSSAEKPKATRNRLTGDTLGFDKFWDAYPRHINKTYAFKMWQKSEPIKKGLVSIEMILKTLEWQKSSKAWLNEQYIPYPGSYINSERWNDEPLQSMNNRSDFDQKDFNKGIDQDGRITI